MSERTGTVVRREQGVITAQQLRMARAGLHWTLGQLAARAGVNPNTLSRYESGREMMSGTLRKVESTLRLAGVIFTEDGKSIGVQLPRDEQ